MLAALLFFLRASSLQAIEIPYLGNPQTKTPPVQAHVLDNDAGVLLSKDKRPLAVLQLRPTDPNRADTDIIPFADATAQLEAASLQLERVRERRFPMLGSTVNATLNVLIQTRAVMQGVRTLVTCSASKPKVDATRAPIKDATPPKLPPLEMAVQIYPDADGKPLKLTYLDGNPVPDEKANPSEIRARAITFENAKKQSVTLERSGPITWTVRQTPNGIFLTARLAKDPRDPAIYGSFLVFLGATHDDASPEVSLIRLDKTVTPARDAIEGSLRVYAAGANPYLSQDVTVVAEVAMPPRVGGLVTTRNLPCFFYESAQPTAEEGEFRFRFAPPVEGLYGVRVFVSTPGSKCKTEAATFRAGVPASSGIARVKPGESVLRLDDGTLFVPVGFDMTRFGMKEGSDVFRDKFIELARLGCNAASISLSKLMPLEGPQAGRVDNDVANELDAIFRAAQARNIRLIFALESGPEIGKGNATHPYFQEMGGNLLASPEYFRDTAAKKYFLARMSYASARYGAFRSLLSWEIMRNLDDAWPLALKKNPNDKSMPPADIDLARRGRRDVEEWLAQVAQQLRGLDQHGHPICVSTALDPSLMWTSLQSVENIDWTLIRDLGNGARTLDEKFPGIETKISQWAEAGRGPQRARRPWSLASLGTPLDTNGPLFAGMANGLASTPLLPCDPTAPISEVERGWLKGAAMFSAALAEISAYDSKDELPPVLQTIGAPGPKAPLLIARSCRRGTAAWIQSKSPIPAGAEFKLPGLSEGTYTITWLDTATGDILLNQPHTAPPQQAGKSLDPLNLTTPQLPGDAALFIVRDPKK
ncbi:MAG: hypothetical protein WCT04_19610 [Planctomycetota bacterium]